MNTTVAIGCNVGLLHTHVVVPLIMRATGLVTTAPLINVAG
jgi:hypothetical protein